MLFLNHIYSILGSGILQIVNVSLWQPVNTGNTPKAVTFQRLIHAAPYWTYGKATPFYITGTVQPKSFSHLCYSKPAWPHILYEKEIKTEVNC